MNNELLQHVVIVNMPMNIFHYGSTHMVSQDVVFITGILVLVIVVVFLKG